MHNTEPQKARLNNIAIGKEHQYNTDMKRDIDLDPLTALLVLFLLVCMGGVIAGIIKIIISFF